MRLLFLPIFLFSFNSLFSQQNISFADKVKVFVDCTNYCDMNYVKTEVNYVDFMPDRFSANVYILITGQKTGSGGEEVKMYFSGKDAFNKMDDTLKFYRTSVSTDDEYRTMLVQYLKLGLTRYLAKTSDGSKLTISFPAAKAEMKQQETAKNDKWNSWVFNVGVSGNFNSDDYSKSYRISGNVRANRITEKLKVYLNTNIQKNERTINFDGVKSSFPNNSSGVNATIVSSLNDHWSAGGFASYSQSSYSNFKNNIIFNPAVEYSFYPYKVAVKKYITVFYKAGPSYARYVDSGYYDKPEHLLFNQTFSVYAGFIQKWGNIDFNASWDNYLNNFTLDNVKIKGKNINTISIGCNLDVRLFKGLSVYYSGFANFSQGIYPNIPRKYFSRDDLITNTRQYPTQKFIYSYFGFNYRFGSIYNNVVNPRFRG